MKNGSSNSSTANSLAIAERPKPATSCLAALFQLFAKRKLFSSSSSKKNKLLPPLRAPKKPARALGGDGKLPVAKTRPLLTEGNDCGDFRRGKSEGNADVSLPSHQDNCGGEMCTPGVVARLMGLSSMPAVRHQRVSKIPHSSELRDSQDKTSQGFSSDNHCRAADSLPRRHQKRGHPQESRHASTGQFSTETHPSWSRRHLHKLASSTKSPRSLSNRNKARLVEAAARVLEPGLHPRNRQLAWPHACLEYLLNDGDASSAAILLNMSDELSRDLGEVAQLRSRDGNEASSSHERSQEEGGKMKAVARRRNTTSSSAAQAEEIGKSSLISSSQKGRMTSMAFQARNNSQRSSSGNTEMKRDTRNNQQRNACRENVASSPLKQNNLKQNALPLVCGAAVPGSMVHRERYREQNAINAAKDFVSLNKNLNSSTSLRSKRQIFSRVDPTRVSSKNKNSSTKGHHPSNESANAGKLKPATPKSLEKDMIIAKGAGLVNEKPKSSSPNSARCDLRAQPELCKVSGGNNTGIVSFTFSSPIKIVPTTLISTDIIEKGGSIRGSDASRPKLMSSNTAHQVFSLQREITFRAELASASEMKTGESASFNQDGLENGNDPIGSLRSSSIFEKTSPVTYSKMSPQTSDVLPMKSVLMDRLNYGSEELSKPLKLHYTYEELQANAKAGNPTASPARGTDHRSPASILDASFIHDDCPSGSSTGTTDMEFGRSSWNKAEPTIMLPCFRSPTSPDNIQSSRSEKNLRYIKPYFSQHDIFPFEPGIQESMLSYSGEVTSSVELLLVHICPPGSHRNNPSFKSFIHETFDSVETAFNVSSKCSSSSKEFEAGNPLKNLAFDFIIECLDAMCGRFWCSSFKSWSKLALLCTRDRLVARVKKELVRCRNVASKALDDLVGEDIEHSNEVCIDSLIEEEFQTHMEIEDNLLQELVSEIVLDLLQF